MSIYLETAGSTTTLGVSSRDLPVEEQWARMSRAGLLNSLQKFHECIRLDAKKHVKGCRELHIIAQSTSDVRFFKPCVLMRRYFYRRTSGPDSLVYEYCIWEVGKPHILLAEGEVVLQCHG